MKKRVTVKTQSLIIIAVGIFLLAAIFKLIYIAVAPKVDGMDLKSFASSRNTKKKTYYAPRGTIYDINGETLALSVNSYTLIAYLEPSRTKDINNPKHVVDINETASKLAPILGIEEETIRKYLSKDAYQVEFGSKGHNLTELVKKQIEDLDLPGLDFIESTQRYYKMGDFASYIIGYAKVDDNGSIKGELGIEKVYNENLSGENGYEEYQSDAYGYQLPNTPSVEVEAKAGDDIYLTLDSNIQLIAENAMQKLDDSEGTFDWAFITIMDAKTGAIVAASTLPSFNPNKLETIKSYMNPLVSYEYEPGSTMKIFTWASAIEEGFYDGDALFDSGSIDVYDVTIRDANKVGWGRISYDTGFAYSSNVGAVNLANKLGKNKLKSYLTKYGFGTKTGIELSNEVTGRINFNYPSEVATASFGQGITITPVQMLQALTAVAGDGTMLKPYIVSKIVNENGETTYQGKRTEVGRVMKETTAEKMRELMYKMNYDGLSTIWRPKTVKMIGKTGTAQVPKEGGGYLEGNANSIYSIAGIFPDDNPKYIIYAAVKRYSASRNIFANTVTNAVDETASYAHLTNENVNEVVSTVVTLENYTSKKAEDIKLLLKEKALEPIVIGKGEYVINQYPYKSEKLNAGGKVFLLTNDTSEIIMPNMDGWSLAQVRNFAKLAKIKMIYTGNGFVSEINVSPGTILHEGDEINVKIKQ